MNTTIELDIRNILYNLGITPKYVGFFHTSYAISLTIQQPERLSLITKWLYPDVARHYHTSCCNVEKNIRLTAARAWKLHSVILDYFARRHLDHRPTNSEFLSILVSYLLTTNSSTILADAPSQTS